MNNEDGKWQGEVRARTRRGASTAQLAMADAIAKAVKAERERVLAGVKRVLQQWEEDSGMEGHGALPYLHEALAKLRSP